ncbi:MAG: alpha/beta hydrolase, partial [Thermomicrobiaceae bacterium]|nr:alpha/beta hydrolase [Thermomicrobiaceae bacterium]
MANRTLLPGVRSRLVETARLRTHLLEAGPEDGAPVVLVHGNVSSSAFWEETLAALPAGYRGLAPDLRGFGDSEAAPVDATRGLRDFADDLRALLDALGLGGRPAHLVGWSMGGGIVMQYAIDWPADVASLTLVDPVAPWGFGGTRDERGTPCWDDFAGSGGGAASPEFVRRLAAGDRSADDPASPRSVMNAFYFRPPFRPVPEREEVYVSSLLSTRVGEDNYPGDLTPSEHWPGVAPGTRGVLNALSPRYLDLGPFARVDPRPPVLWVRGADDLIVSDTSMLDFGYLGQIGAVPGWPGAEVYPPQPMVAQMRALLEAYRAAGGAYEEHVVAACGHSPHVERPDEFRRLLFG